MTEQLPPPLEKINQHYRFMEARLSGVPELQPAFDIYDKDPQHAADIYTGYLKVIDYMSRLDQVDVETITAAQRTLELNGGVVGSASKVGANDIISATIDRGDLLTETAAESSNSSSPFYNDAVGTLVSRLEGGHQLKVDGKSPSDFDPDSLKVIWGHTVISGPEALLHFVTCHYLERYFAEAFIAQDVDIARQKDFFINAMVDVLVVDSLKDNKFNSIFNIWATPKEQGGLGWITPSRLNSYSRV